MSATPAAKELAATLNQHVDANKPALDALQKAFNGYLQLIDATIGVSRLAARSAVMAEDAIAEAQAANTRLQQEVDALRPLLSDNDHLRKRIAELEAQIASMSTHPDVIAAKEKRAAEEHEAKVNKLAAEAKALGLTVKPTE